MSGHSKAVSRRIKFVMEPMYDLLKTAALAGFTSNSVPRKQSYFSCPLSHMPVNYPAVTSGVFIPEVGGCVAGNTGHFHSIPALVMVFSLV